jgi:hypothetical protein
LAFVSITAIPPPERANANSGTGCAPLPIDARQLELLARWLDKEPEVPEGPWYKRVSCMTVCGDGDLVKTFLTPDQNPKGTSA